MPRGHYRFGPEIQRRIKVLSHLHGGVASDAVREAINRYYEGEPEKVREIEALLKEIGIRQQKIDRVAGAAEENDA